MKQTLLVKLAPTPDQHAALLRTLEQFNAACNAIAAVAFAERRAGKLDLQRLVYYDVRRDFGLSAQMAIRRCSPTFGRTARWSTTSASARSPALIVSRCWRWMGVK